MTLALIMLVVFIISWWFNSAKIKENKQTHRKKTITNVALQDELWCENFKKVIKDMEEIDAATPIGIDKLMETIESLFQKYNIPDSRDESEKQKVSSSYLNSILLEQQECVDEKHRYPINPSEIPLPLKICYNLYTSDKKIPPEFKNPILLFGAPDTIKTVDGYIYKYNYTGRAQLISEPYSLICIICNLLTIRDLNERGFYYSWDRQESLWQKSKQRIEGHERDKKKYPWLYK